MASSRESNSVQYSDRERCLETKGISSQVER